MQTTRRLCRESGIAVALVTHHMSEAAACDRVVVMDAGRVVLDGPPRVIFSGTDALKAAGLAPPQTVQLLDRLRRAGLNVPSGALTPEECADAIFSACRARGDVIY
jgi:energy-coupling factor transport system ATP-binding protein